MGMDRHHQIQFKCEMPQYSQYGFPNLHSRARQHGENADAHRAYSHGWGPGIIENICRTQSNMEPQMRTKPSGETQTKP